MTRKKVNVMDLPGDAVVAEKEASGSGLSALTDEEPQSQGPKAQSLSFPTQAWDLQTREPRRVKSPAKERAKVPSAVN